MQAWRSLDEIIERFELSSFSQDVESLIDELSTRRAQLHPDKYGGRFPSEQHASKYLELNSAIEFLENLQLGSIILPPPQLPDLRRHNVRFPTRSEEIRDSIELVGLIKERYTREISLYFRFPRISSAAIGGVSTAIFVFWDSVKDNPVFSGLEQDPQARAVWLFFMILAGVIFLLSYWYELALQAYFDMVVSEDGLFVAIKNIVEGNSKDISNFDADGSLRFSKRQLLRLISSPRYFTRSPFNRFLPDLSGNTAIQCVDIAISKLEKKGILREPVTDFDEWYLIPSILVDKLRRAEIELANNRQSPVGLLLILLTATLIIYVFFVLTGVVRFSGLPPSSYSTSSPTETLPLGEIMPPLSGYIELTDEATVEVVATIEVSLTDMP